MVSVMDGNLVFTMHAANKEFGQGKKAKKFQSENV
jgi:hypothetical protein